jgi:tRNA uridine 5-carboxymethylaminomethyl modification enzyme
VLSQAGTAGVETRISLFQLLKRPEMTLERVEGIAARLGLDLSITTDVRAREQLELAGAYDGYIQRQEKLADQAKKLEDLRIPANFDYTALSLSFETREKLGRIRPQTVGQASRVPGVRPSDIAIIIGYVRAKSKVARA